ncbi:hypothetical protein JYU34_019745 [Plutella xylostella]|uniref:Uncharacterized protein n=1 Tax=Plutella xylostella TaxID=51655 RepID=A0ABQ7PVH2_PLUXY|nr:hypothetical protein JYU34_019745 [Plutella xylostella]
MHCDAAHGVTLDAIYGVNRRPRPNPLVPKRLSITAFIGMTSNDCLHRRVKSGWPECNITSPEVSGYS